MPSSIITLTTDFGLSDHFTGVMKGVILGICPRARIVDITHLSTPFEVSEAAFTLAQSYRYFPKGTVHVVVVDPGVGSARRPILASGGGYHFVAPDNGVLSMIFTREKCRVREISAEKYWVRPVSQTFHGRDIFAPVAAHLAKGVPPARFGKVIQDALRSDFETFRRIGKRVWSGAILKVDRFGNLITNLPSAEFAEIHTRPFELSVGMEKITRLATAYVGESAGVPFAIAGSSGYLEVAINQDSAARRLGCGAGAPVELVIL
jgi:S-adenosyl-L-methionine hydrolase (adenosine-forming)